MKANELINKLKEFDSSLILKTKNKNQYFELSDIFENHNNKILIINSWKSAFKADTVQDLINYIEQENKNNYDIGRSIWMNMHNEADIQKINIEFTNNFIELIMDIQVI